MGQQWRGRVLAAARDDLLVPGNEELPSGGAPVAQRRGGGRASTHVPPPEGHVVCFCVVEDRQRRGEITQSDDVLSVEGSQSLATRQTLNPKYFGQRQPPFDRECCDLSRLESSTTLIILRPVFSKVRSGALTEGLGWSAPLGGSVLAQQLRQLGDVHRHVDDTAMCQRLASAVPTLYSAICALDSTQMQVAATVLREARCVWVGNGFQKPSKVRL